MAPCCLVALVEHLIYKKMICVPVIFSKVFKGQFVRRLEGVELVGFLAINSDRRFLSDAK